MTRTFNKDSSVKTQMASMIRRTLLASALLSGLGGCANIQHEDKSVDQMGKTVESEQAKAQEAQPVGTRTSDAWLLGDAVDVKPEVSPVLLRKIAWHPSHKVSLAELAAYVTATAGLPVDVSEVMRIGGSTTQDQLVAPSVSGVPGATISPPTGVTGGTAGATRGYAALPLIRVDFDGDVQGLLDYADNEEGIYYSFDDGAVRFFRTLSRTFYIPALSRKTTGNNAIQAQSSSNTSGSGTSGVASSGSGVGGGSNGGTGGLNANDEDDVDFWKNIDATVKTVAGGDAQVATNPSYMSVTVTGSPSQVKNVEVWAKGMSDHFSQMVLITLKTYIVTLSSEDNYNWSPSTIVNKMSSAYGFSLTPAGAPPVTGSIAPAIISATAGSSSRLDGSAVAVSALSTLGNVSEGITQSVMTLNGQPAIIQVGNQKTYVASAGSTLAANVGSSTTLTPGVASSGYTIKFHPNVIDGKVLLDMDLNDITLNEIDTITTGGVTIGEPNLSPTLITESASLTPGSALLMSSISIDNTAVNHSGTGSAFNPLLGGGVDGTRTKKLVAVVVTARVL